MEKFSLHKNKPTELSRMFLKYYEFGVFHEVKLKSTATIYTTRKYPFVYTITRLLTAISITCLLRLLYFCIVEGRKSRVSVAGEVSQILLYILSFVMIPYFDIYVFMSEVLPNLEKTLITCDHIWSKIGYMNQQARALKHQMAFKIWRIFLHTW